MAKELANVKGTEFQLALPEKQAEAALKKGNLVEIHNADKSEKYFIATDPYYKTMMVFDAEEKKQYVHNTKKMSNAMTGSIPEKQESKQAEKSKVEAEQKTKKKKVSIKM
jgi:DNA-binding transcriptional regulator GbsR (MarR family)